MAYGYTKLFASFVLMLALSAASLFIILRLAGDDPPKPGPRRDVAVESTSLEQNDLISDETTATEAESVILSNDLFADNVFLTVSESGDEVVENTETTQSSAPSLLNDALLQETYSANIEEDVVVEDVPNAESFDSVELSLEDSIDSALTLLGDVAETTDEIVFDSNELDELETFEDETFVDLFADDAPESDAAFGEENLEETNSVSIAADQTEFEIADMPTIFTNAADASQVDEIVFESNELDDDADYAFVETDFSETASDVEEAGESTFVFDNADDSFASDEIIFDSNDVEGYDDETSEFESFVFEEEADAVDGSFVEENEITDEIVFDSNEIEDGEAFETLNVETPIFEENATSDDFIFDSNDLADYEEEEIENDDVTILEENAASDDIIFDSNDEADYDQGDETNDVIFDSNDIDDYGYDELNEEEWNADEENAIEQTNESDATEIIFDSNDVDFYDDNNASDAAANAASEMIETAEKKLDFVASIKQVSYRSNAENWNKRGDAKKAPTSASTPSEERSALSVADYRPDKIIRNGSSNAPPIGAYDPSALGARVGDDFADADGSNESGVAISAPEATEGFARSGYTKNERVSEPSLNDELWIVESYGSSFQLWRCDAGKWQSVSLEEFYSTDDPRRATVFWAHGYQTDMSSAVTSGLKFDSVIRRARTSTGVRRAFRLVIWKWSSERNLARIRVDAKIKVQTANSEGVALGSLVSRMNPADDITLAGFSFGACVVGRALETLAHNTRSTESRAGGVGSQSRGRLSLIMVSAACDGNAFEYYGQYGAGALLPTNVINLYNPIDYALQYYPFVSDSLSSALGAAPLNGATFSRSSGRVYNINVSSVVAKRHSFTDSIGLIPDDLLSATVL